MIALFNRLNIHVRASLIFILVFIALGIVTTWPIVLLWAFCLVFGAMVYYSIFDILRGKSGSRTER